MKWFNLILALVFSLSTSAQTVTSDTLQIGKPGSSANKEIKAGSGRGAKPGIRYNTSNSKWEFSNDASIYKGLGSGSGSGSGGVNLLDNGGFEDGIASNWTNTGATYVAETGSNKLFGDRSAVWTPTAAGQSLMSVAVAFPKLIQDGKCVVKMKYTGGDSNSYLTIVDSSNAEPLPTATRAVLNSSSGTKEAKVYFDCYSTGTYKFALKSTAAGAAVTLDNAHLGEQDGQPVKQAEMFGRLRWVASSGCDWPASNISWGGIGVDAACNLPLVYGAASAPATKIPAITFATLPAGKYRVVLTGQFSFTTGNVNQTGWARFSDGTNFSSPMVVAGNSSNAWAFMNGIVEGTFEYTTDQTNVTFALQERQTSGSVSLVGDSNDIEMTVYKYPSNSDTVVSSKCYNPLDCENEFGAYIFTTGAVAQENLDWINGSCTKGGTGVYTCNYSQTLNHPMTCVATAIGTANYLINQNVNTNTQIGFQARNTAGTLVDADFTVKCTKSLTDFKSKQDIKGFFKRVMPNFYVRSTNNQNINHNTVTTVLFNVEDEDDLNIYNPATGVATIPESGRYSCGCQVGVNQPTNLSAATISAGITDSTGTTTLMEDLQTAYVSNNYAPDAHGIRYYPQGYGLKCVVFQNTGSAKVVLATAYSKFYCAKISD